MDLAVFADQRDVKPDEINRRFSHDYDLDVELLAEALKWCWCNQAEIRFEENAVKTLLAEATNLYNTFFCENIPVVTIDMKWKLARLSAALAYLTLSTDDYKIIKVTEEHVKEVVSFIQAEYSRVGLNILAQESRFEVLTEEEAKAIISRLCVSGKGEVVQEETVLQIAKFIVLKGRVTREQVKQRFGLTENNQARPLFANLSNENLIRTGNGIYPTPKLIELFRILNKDDKVNEVKKGPLIISSEGNETKQSNPSFSGLVSVVNFVKFDDLKNVSYVSDSYGWHPCWV